MMGKFKKSICIVNGVAAYYMFYIFIDDRKTFIIIIAGSHVEIF